jgi:hypothetical protein
MLSGGYWFDSQRRKWVCAGSAVLEQVTNRRSLAELLGLPVSKVEKPRPGDVQLFPLLRKPRRRPPPIEWKDTKAALYFPAYMKSEMTPRALWDKGKSFIAWTGDKVRVGDHVLVRPEMVCTCS